MWRFADDQWQRVEELELIYNLQEVDSCTGEVEEVYLVELLPEEPMGVREQYFAFATCELKGVADPGGAIFIWECSPIWWWMRRWI